MKRGVREIVEYSPMSIWQFYDVVSQRLLTYNVINILVGVALLPFRPFWRGFGSQNIGWGIINLGIALVGATVSERRFASLHNPHAPEIVEHEAHNLRRILLVNTALDLLYILAGWNWGRSQKKSFARGMGWGVVLQGVLLFTFDLVHALAVPDRVR